MRKTKVLFLVVVSGMLLVFYNNCGRPVSLQKSANLNLGNENSGNLENEKIATYDSYQLVATSAGVVTSVQVSPEQIVVYPSTSSEGIACSWEELINRGATSLVQLGGMEALSFSFTNGVCRIDVRDEPKSKALKKNVWHDPQELCFNFEGTLPICQTFLQTPLPENSIRRTKAEMLLQRANGSGSSNQLNSRLFDSQNG